MSGIVRDSKLPFYHQIYEILRNRILQGDLQPGDMLPPESELIEHYQVSRITVRQALDALVKDGLIYRQRGRGSFVAPPKIEQGLTRIISFTEDMRQRGYQSETKVLVSKLVPAPQEIAEKLLVGPGEELTCLERLRLADGVPLSVEISYLVHRYCPGILQHNYARTPLREALERDYGIRLARARQVIRAVPARRGLAHKLSVPANAALLFIERVSYSQDDTPVEFLRVYHRGDRYALYNELQG